MGNDLWESVNWRAPFARSQMERGVV